MENSVTISKCPVCNASHTYDLEINRQPYPNIARDVSFTRLFTCPVKQKDFRATFVLSESFTFRITSVRVIGHSQRYQRAEPGSLEWMFRAKKRT